MLYIDTSALAKRYIAEPGSGAMQARLRQSVESNEQIFTSALAYAEMLTLFGRRYQSGAFQAVEFRKASEDFLRDWSSGLSILELDARTMGSLSDLTVKYPLKSADAVHLSAALWLRDSSRVVHAWAGADLRVEFAVADKALARIAADCGLAVFNPESASP